MGEIPRRSKKNFSVGMTIVNWWLSDPLFLSGVYRSQVEIDFSIYSTPFKKIPYRGYHLARNDKFVDTKKTAY
jgi:hypothetical protein